MCCARAKENLGNFGDALGSSDEVLISVASTVALQGSLETHGGGVKAGAIALLFEDVLLRE